MTNKLILIGLILFSNYTYCQKNDTTLKIVNKPEIFISGFIDVMNNGQVNASARSLFRLSAFPYHWPLYTLDTSNVDFTDTVSLKSIVSANSEIFFNQKGLDYNEIYHPLGLDIEPPRQLPIVSSAYSTAGSNLMDEFQNKLDDFYANDDMDSLLSQLNLLKDSALKLSSETDVLNVGLPISVAINSFTYWKLNGQRWMDILGKDDGTGTSEGGPSFHDNDKNLKKPKINLYQLGGADLTGAINGAMGGGLAGAVLVSSTLSLGNLAHQVISSYVSWWLW